MMSLQSIISSKQFQSCNKFLINQACSGPYWENIGPWSFFTDLAALGPYCQDLGPIFFQYGPHAWLIRYIYYMASSVSGQDDPNRALWLATRAGKMEPSCPLGTTRCIPQAKFCQKPYNKSFIDQVCSVKMAGYWPRSFFGEFMDLDFVSVYKLTKNSAGHRQFCLYDDMASWYNSQEVILAPKFCPSIFVYGCLVPRVPVPWKEDRQSFHSKQSEMASDKMCRRILYSKSNCGT